MKFEVGPVSGGLGAEVLGVDLASLTDDEWDAVHSLWLEHLVLFFPDQHLDAEGHLQLARRFGEPEIHPYLPKLDEQHPEIVVLDSATGVRVNFWHTDVAFVAQPPKASILQMVTTPPSGGDTLWSNQYLAYETLSAPMRELLDGLTAVHDAASHGRPEVMAEHPAVCVHPETGRRSLFVNGTSTSGFVELNRHESDGLLTMLQRWCERPEFQCRYRWTEGSVAIWDNRCTQHYAVDDYSGDRVGQRITINGGAPSGTTGSGT